jgi:hypothetical protein
MVNITKETENYIQNHPFIKQAVKNNIVNYSKLARLISQEKKILSLDAILIACRRYYDKLKKTNINLSIMDLLSKSKLSIRSNIIVIILDPDVSFKRVVELQKEIDEKNEIIHVVRGTNAVTLITTDDFFKRIENIFKNNIFNVSKDLVEIVIKSSVKLESVPGVMAHMYSLFGENDINIIETLSCWTDTILVIKKEDLAKSMDLLSFKT